MAADACPALSAACLRVRPTGGLRCTRKGTDEQFLSFLSSLSCIVLASLTEALPGAAGLTVGRHDALSTSLGSVGPGKRSRRCRTSSTDVLVERVHGDPERRPGIWVAVCAKLELSHHSFRLPTASNLSLERRRPHLPPFFLVMINPMSHCRAGHRLWAGNQQHGRVHVRQQRSAGVGPALGQRPQQCAAVASWSPDHLHRHEQHRLGPQRGMRHVPVVQVARCALAVAGMLCCREPCTLARFVVYVACRRCAPGS